jgi:isopentenyl-diphosphate delta-isomerase
VVSLSWQAGRLAGVRSAWEDLADNAGALYVAIKRGGVVGDLVVLLNDAGEFAGTAEKLLVHHAATPLHLAFSCYVFQSGESGLFLSTRRALSKKTWPGVWSNSFCGHPGPGEAMEDAIERRAQEELGIQLTELRPVIPDFRYRVTLDGIVENEMCPVFIAATADAPAPDPAEVAEFAWTRWLDFQRVDERSPWSKLQTARLKEYGYPAQWPTVASGFPPAAKLRN